MIPKERYRLVPPVLILSLSGTVYFEQRGAYTERTLACLAVWHDALVICADLLASRFMQAVERRATSSTPIGVVAFPPGNEMRRMPSWLIFSRWSVRLCSIYGDHVMHAV